MTELTYRDGPSTRTTTTAVAIALLSVFVSPTPAPAEADAFQQAVNYVFTGSIDPKNAPEITDRTACVVQIPDPINKRSIRYHLGRFRMETARFEKLYAGRTYSYRLFIAGDDNVVEYLNPDMTVAHGYRDVQIPLPGDIDRAQKALNLIADQCKDQKSKAPF